jgi:hypothetical protein
MTSRAQVLALVRSGHSYESAARSLGIPAGQAYLIATGVPADASDSPHPEERHEAPLIAGGSQDLVNPPSVNPARDEQVIAWVRGRAERELSRRE